MPPRKVQRFPTPTAPRMGKAPTMPRKRPTLPAQASPKAQTATTKSAGSNAQTRAYEKAMNSAYAKTKTYGSPKK